jgi:uncharacterized protein YjiS (DUF1127 family)
MPNTAGFSLNQAREPVRESLIGRAFAAIGERIGRFKMINELEQLSDRQLRDIGVERREIDAIAEREFAKLRAH